MVFNCWLIFIAITRLISQEEDLVSSSPIASGCAEELGVDISYT